MESSSEVWHDVLDSTKSDLQICHQTIHLLTPSTSTKETNPVMPLESEAIYEQKGVIEEGLNIPFSTEKELLVYELQSINASIQQLVFGLKECNVRILEKKVAHKTLLNNLNLPAMSNKDLVDAFEWLIASKNKILAEKVAKNEHLFVIKEVLNKISGRLINLSSVDKELDAFEMDCKNELTAQKSLLVKIIELSNTMSNELHVNYLDI